MSIIIKQGVSVLPKKLINKQGFTLVEIIVVLAIFSLLLTCLAAGALQAVLAQQKSNEKQAVLYLVQQIYAGRAVEISDSLSYTVTTQRYSEQLTEKIIRVENTDGQHWTFYYLQGDKR